MGALSRDTDAVWVQGRHDKRKIEKIKAEIIRKLDSESHNDLLRLSEDREFQMDFGPMLQRVGPQDLIDIALKHLLGVVKNAPSGMCGIFEIDRRRHFNENGLRKFYGKVDTSSESSK